MTAPSPPPDPAVLRFRKVRELFHEALELSAAERRAFLDRECEGDAELAREVRELLASHDDADSFLEEPATAFLTEEWTAELEARALELPGARLGPYEIDGELGRGAVGAVYLAHRAGDPRHRRLALKLVPGEIPAPALERFRAWREILSRLEHPNVAHLEDAGTSPAGSTFFLSEHVEGEPIDLYCQRRSLSTTKRLLLFGKVCAAVQAAHQNLIVHRAIKPANVLVTPAGVPKLLDLGTAALTTAPRGDSLEERAAAVARLGNPEYIAPEEVLGRPITVAADVFSLGALLYHLLTGKRPYPIPRNQPLQLASVLCEQIPARPSTVIGWSESVVDVTDTIPLPFSRQEQGSLLSLGRAERLRRRLAGDLDAIVMKALRKEPERRYASVEQLAEDLRRHLSGRPVLAQPETLGYVAGKFVKRHRLRLLAAAALGVALLGGAGWAALEIRHHKERELLESVHLLRDIEREMAAQGSGRGGRGAPLAVRALPKLDRLDRLARQRRPGDLADELAAGYQWAGDVLANAPSPGDRRKAEASRARAAYWRSQR